VYYCSKSCKNRHWSEHQILCNAIKEQLNKKMKLSEDWEIVQTQKCLLVTFLQGNTLQLLNLLVGNALFGVL
jgi:hypothetical protein